MSVGPVMIGSEIYRRSRYGSKHPLSIPRVSTAIDLVRALGWLPDDRYLDSPIATEAELRRFHDPDYLRALRRAERDGDLPDAAKDRFRIGLDGNPIFGEVFSRPATACGASLLAAEMLAAAPSGLIHNPAGGTHHGRPDRASGFCYLNDPVLAILRMRDRGLARIAYVDVDAHHGDGVQDAFADDPDVLTISVHEDRRWPRTGAVSDRAGGAARNVPVPEGLNDSEMALIRDAAILPLVDAFRPQSVVLQCGADALHEDPLSRLSLSNGALWETALLLRPLAPRMLVLGGGGYNPWSVGRAWAGVWGVLTGAAIPDRLPPAAEAVLRALTWTRAAGRNPPEAWMTTLRDPPRPGPIRSEVRTAVAAVTA